jgi:hypothetical protein
MEEQHDWPVRALRWCRANTSTLWWVAVALLAFLFFACNGAGLAASEAPRESGLVAVRFDTTEADKGDSVAIPVRWSLASTTVAIDSFGFTYGWDGAASKRATPRPYLNYRSKTLTLPKATAGRTQHYWACLNLYSGKTPLLAEPGQCAGRARQSVLGDPTGLRQIVPAGYSGSGTMQVVISVNMPTQTRAALLACGAAASAQSDPVRAVDACRSQLNIPTATSYVTCAYAADTSGVVWVLRDKAYPGNCDPLFAKVRNGAP